MMVILRSCKLKAKMNECHFSVNSMHGTHVKDNEKVV